MEVAFYKINIITSCIISTCFLQSRRHVFRGVFSGDVACAGVFPRRSPVGEAHLPTTKRSRSVRIQHGSSLPYPTLLFYTRQTLKKAFDL